MLTEFIRTDTGNVRYNDIFVQSITTAFRGAARLVYRPAARTYGTPIPFSAVQPSKFYLFARLVGWYVDTEHEFMTIFTTAKYVI